MAKTRQVQNFTDLTISILSLASGVRFPAKHPNAATVLHHFGGQLVVGGLQPTKLQRAWQDFSPPELAHIIQNGCDKSRQNDTNLLARTVTIYQMEDRVLIILSTYINLVIL